MKTHMMVNNKDKKPICHILTAKKFTDDPDLVTCGICVSRITAILKDNDNIKVAFKLDISKNSKSVKAIPRVISWNGRWQRWVTVQG